MAFRPVQIPHTNASLTKGNPVVVVNSAVASEVTTRTLTAGRFFLKAAPDQKEIEKAFPNGTVNERSTLWFDTILKEASPNSSESTALIAVIPKSLVRDADGGHLSICGILKRNKEREGVTVLVTVRLCLDPEQACCERKAHSGHWIEW